MDTIEAMRRATRVGAVGAGILALAAATCGAPESQALEGPVAREVAAALDSGTASFGHAEWDRLLAGGVRGGLVDYRFFQERREELEDYLERVAGADLARLAPGHLEALLVNAYNAYTVRTILEHPRVSSIREIEGVWTEIAHTVGGHELTLDQLEHNLLRPFFRDPRIHFVLNCASLSCAPLPTRAFSGDSLGPQLEERTRAFLRDTANVRIEGERLLLSRYFDWYGEDFTGRGWSPRAETIPRFVARYSRPEVAELVRRHDGRPPVSFLGYDWSLNAATRPAPAEGTGTGTGRAGDPPGEGGGRAGGAEAGAPSGTEPPSGEGWVAELRGWVAGLGPAAPVAYGLAYVLATVLFVPGSPLTVGAGVAFGLLWGTVLVSIASTIGAALAFLVARHLLRGRVTSWVEGRPRWTAIDRAVGREGWRIVALTRLSPVFPFNLLNYAYGLTRVGFGGYVLASWVAMLPGTLLYVYAGAAGVRVAAAATGAADWGRTALHVVGLAATLAVALLIGRIATRALREAAGEEAVEGPEGTEEAGGMEREEGEEEGRGGGRAGTPTGGPRPADREPVGGG